MVWYGVEKLERHVVPHEQPRDASAHSLYVLEIDVATKL